MIQLYGRANSSNVWKPLGVLEELGQPYQRHDAGIEHGVVDTPAYRTLNPNSRIPALRHDGLELWESNSIYRYLCMMVGGDARGLYPHEAGARARVDRWLDWQLSTHSPAERDLFWNMVRTPEAKRATKAVKAVKTAVMNSAACWAIVEARMSDGRLFIEGPAFTLAEIVLGCFARRWFGPEVHLPDMPAFPHLTAWYARLAERPGFQNWGAPPLS
jgi:glutathione S-transferase